MISLHEKSDKWMYTFFKNKAATKKLKIFQTAQGSWLESPHVLAVVLMPKHIGSLGSYILAPFILTKNKKNH